MEPYKILIAEDDRNIRAGVADALELEGYIPVEAPDGGAALRLYHEHHPDLLLLDIMMPGLSGYDVCRRVRQDDPLIPIIMLTAKGEEFDKVLGLELGADDYVTKPFGLRELAARIAAQLRRRQSEEGESLPPAGRAGPGSRSAAGRSSDAGSAPSGETNRPSLRCGKSRCSNCSPHIRAKRSAGTAS